MMGIKIVNLHINSVLSEWLGYFLVGSNMKQNKSLAVIERLNSNDSLRDDKRLHDFF